MKTELEIAKERILELEKQVKKLTSNTVLPVVLQGQIEMLNELQHTTAYNGELGNLKQSSYVLYADILKVMNEKRKMLKDLQNCR